MIYSCTALKEGCNRGHGLSAAIKLGSLEKTVFGLKPFFDQVPNKDFALMAAGQFATKLQEFGLWGSQLDGTVPNNSYHF